MEDVKAMRAVFTSDLMKDVLSKLSVQFHDQIIAYWHQKSKEWLSAQQFVTHMGRDCTQTMAMHLNKWGITYDDLRDIFEKCKTDETVFHSHLLEAGAARRPWQNKLWQHFLKKIFFIVSIVFTRVFSTVITSNQSTSWSSCQVNNFIVNLRLLFRLPIC